MAFKNFKYGLYTRKYSKYVKQTGGISNDAEFTLLKQDDGTYVVKSITGDFYLRQYCYFWIFTTSISDQNKMNIVWNEEKKGYTI